LKTKEGRGVSGGQDVPFGTRLRRLRETAGLTQEELAEMADLSAKGISDLERGERRRPYPHTVRSLADALTLSEDERASLLAAVPERGRGGSPALAVAPEPSLPDPPTPLVGRERDVEEISAFLHRQDVRLLTLTGTGGVGKTRLALEAARDAADLFPDGVTFVALAPLNKAELVVPTVIRSLGLREAKNQTPREVLRTHLRGKRLLLVLDNFEHVAEAALEVFGLIEVCPNLSVLVTSRAPLRVRGEQEYPVEPLALPASTRSPKVEEVSDSASGRLFVERAREATHTFELTVENAGAVASICWRLAGLPLALELAAAKARFLDPATMLSRLDQALATGWARDLPERQRTMRASLDWSYNLLDGPQQELFGRLSVFSGGFTLEAAEVVGAAGQVRSGDVLDLLGSLVEQSLVVGSSTDGGLRYGMLEPVRQYALERLEESGEAGEARRRHAQFFLALAERAEPEIKGHNQVEWLDKLEVEYDNLSAAIGRSLEADDVTAAARFGWALASNEYDRAARYFREALMFASELGSRVHSAFCMQGLAAVAAAQNDPRGAARLLGAAEVLMENAGILLVQADRELPQQVASDVRERLGEKAWTASRVEGRAMSVEQAEEYALMGNAASPSAP
jgi:predicted ATPase/DNA-binding XRE family transcriptional regulator